MTRSTPSATAWTLSVALLASCASCARGIGLGLSGDIPDDAESVPSFDASTVEASSTAPPSSQYDTPGTGPLAEGTASYVDAALGEPSDAAPASAPTVVEASPPAVETSAPTPVEAGPSVDEEAPDAEPDEDDEASTPTPTPACSPSSCSNLCIPYFVQCCKSDSTCGCSLFFPPGPCN